jgi:hypothetical protein
LTPCVKAAGSRTAAGFSEWLRATMEHKIQSGDRIQSASDGTAGTVEEIDGDVLKVCWDDGEISMEPYYKVKRSLLRATG